MIGAAFRILSVHVITSPFTRRNEPPKYSTLSEILSLILCKQSEITLLSLFKLDMCIIVPTKECAKGANDVIFYINNGSTSVYWNGTAAAIWCTFDIEKVPQTCCVIIFPYVLLRICTQSTGQRSLSRAASLISKACRWCLISAAGICKSATIHLRHVCEPGGRGLEAKVQSSP